jgi:hypothetical protein
MNKTIVTPWGYGDFMPNPLHTLQIRVDDQDRAYCLRCGDEVQWRQPNGGQTMARDNLVHCTKTYAEYQECYTPRLPERGR